MTMLFLVLRRLSIPLLRTRAPSIKLKLPASLVAAALIACISQLTAAATNQATSNPCGLNRAKRIIQMIESVKDHAEQLPAAIFAGSAQAAPLRWNVV